MTQAHSRWWRDYWAAKAGADWPGEDEGRADLGPLYRRQVAVIECLIDRHPLRHVLELGCGDGHLYDHLGFAGIDYWGVDLAGSKINAFRERHPELRLFHADAAAFRTAQQFDLIFSVSLLHYLDIGMVRRLLDNAHAMLADDGILLITDFRWRSHQWQEYVAASAALARADSLPGLRQRFRDLDQMRRTRAFSRSEISALGARAGFTTEVLGSLVLPGYLTARMTKTVASPRDRGA